MLRTLSRVSSLAAMSALPPKADIGTQSRNVRFVPKADISPVIHSMRAHEPKNHPMTVQQVRGLANQRDGRLGVLFHDPMPGVRNYPFFHIARRKAHHCGHRRAE